MSQDAGQSGDDGQRQRLGSWKEIAAFLDVTVRTAQLWERNRGLPVHRVPGEARSRVFAYVDEISAWIDSGRRDREEPAAPEPTPTPTPRRSRRLTIGLAATLAAVLVTIALSVALSRPDLSTIELTVDGETLQFRDAGGDVYAEQAFPGINGKSYEPGGGYPRFGLLDVDGDGREEVWFNRDPPTADAMAQLVLLERDGRERWRIDASAKPPYEPGRFSGLLRVATVAACSLDGRPVLIAAMHQAEWYPSRLSVHDPADGSVVAARWHPGVLLAVICEDLDGDGRPEIVAGGRNNPGPGYGLPALMVLRAPDAAARTTDGSNTGARPDEMPLLSYTVFPLVDVVERTSMPAAVQRLEWSDDGLLLVSVNRQTGSDLRYALSFVDPSSPSLVSTRVGDLIKVEHRHLEDEGRLQHAWDADDDRAIEQFAVFDTIPDCNDRASMPDFLYPARP